MNPPDPSVPPLEAPRDTQGTCLGRGPAVLCHHLDGNSRVLAAIARARRAFTRSAEARRAINGASSQGPALPHWGLPVRATMQGCSECPSLAPPAILGLLRMEHSSVTPWPRSRRGHLFEPARARATFAPPVTGYPTLPFIGAYHSGDFGPASRERGPFLLAQPKGHRDSCGQRYCT